MRNSTVFFICIGVFFGVMTGILGCLVMEYAIYYEHVREMVELKRTYTSSVIALRRKLAEVDRQREQPVPVQEKPGFCVVDRTPERLQQEAIQFARQHNLEKPIQQLYDGESRTRRAITARSRTYRTRKRKITRYTITKHAYNQKIARARMMVLRVFGDLNWAWPLERECFWISSHFGPRRKPNGALGFHTGIDLAAVKGTPVTSVGAGIVEETHYGHKGYGNTVVVRHNKRLRTRYAHLATIMVQKGMTIEKGAKIGTVGNTGHVRKRRGRDGTHLHFEIYIGKKQMNPLYFLSD